MSILSKIICGASVFASTALAQNYTPAEMVITSADNYSVTLKKEYIDSQFRSWTITDVIENNPSSVEYVDGSLECILYYCFANFKIYKKGSVDFSNQGYIGNLPYGYADVADPVLDTAYINTQLWTSFHIAEVLTQPSASETQRGPFDKIGRAESSKLDETYDYVLIRTLIGLNAMEEGDPTEYQNLHFLASGQSIFKLYDIDLVGEDYMGHDANKGTTYAFQTNDAFSGTFYWGNSNWDLGTGHYAAWRFFTNGTSEFDAGVDLSSYNNITFDLECKPGWVVEVFVGGGHDSFQHFLSDITCDGEENTYTYTLSGDRSDIQTGLWFHIPVWKNTSMGQDHGAWMNLGKAVLYE